jgi:hypothetical protein
MSSDTTFVQAVLDGDALISDVDDWVDAWHDSAGAPGGRSLSLGAYLGMTPDEYALWVERPESLRFVVKAHKSHIDALEVEEIAGLAAAAARAGDDAEAAGVVHWLRQTGRLSDSNAT